MLNPAIIQSAESPTPVTPPLDLYPGAVGAYSFRRMSSTYAGPCIRVIRSSDGLTQDIGFDAYGGLNVPALRSFVGSNTQGSITIWYDQSSNGKDMKIYGSGSFAEIISFSGALRKANGKPAFHILDSGLQTVYMSQGIFGSLLLSNDSLSVYAAGRSDVVGSSFGHNGVVGADDDISDFKKFVLFADNKLYFGDGVNIDSLDTGVPSNQGSSYSFIVSTTARASNDREIYYNGVSKGTSTTNYSFTSFNPTIPSKYRGIRAWPDGSINEVILYNVGHNDPLAISIHENMNNYYNIY